MARLILPILILLHFTFRGFWDKTVWGHWHGFPLDDFWIIFGAWAVLTFMIARRFRAHRSLWILPALFAVLAVGSRVQERRAYAALQKARSRLQENQVQLFWGFVFYSRSFDLCVQTFVDGDRQVPDERIKSAIAETFRVDGFQLAEIHLTKAQK